MFYPSIERFLTQERACLSELFLSEVDLNLNTEAVEALLEDIATKSTHLVQWISSSQIDRHNQLKNLIPQILEEVKKDIEWQDLAEKRLDFLERVLLKIESAETKSLQEMAKSLKLKTLDAKGKLSNKRDTIPSIESLESLGKSTDQAVLEIGSIELTLKYLKDLTSLYEEYKKSHIRLMEERDSKSELASYIDKIKKSEEEQNSL